MGEYKFIPQPSELKDHILNQDQTGSVSDHEEIPMGSTVEIATTKLGEIDSQVMTQSPAIHQTKSKRTIINLKEKPSSKAEICTQTPTGEIEGTDFETQVVQSKINKRSAIEFQRAPSPSVPERTLQMIKNLTLRNASSVHTSDQQFQTPDAVDNVA